MKPIILSFAALAAAFLFYLLCLNHVSINEIGIAYDSRDGTIAVQHPGWHVTNPLTRATTITLLPVRVEATFQSGARVLNVKLVRFVPAHVQAFIDTQGFQYMGGCETSIFAGYAFSGKAYPFLEVIQ